MGTFCTIEIVSDSNKEQATKMVSDAFQMIQNLEQKMSTFQPDSEISKLNKRRSSNKFLLSKDLFHVIHQSIEFSRLTGGAFDITVRPLLTLWRTPDSISDSEAISRVKKKTGYQFIKLNPQEGSIVFKNPEVSMDLGGIGKGYAMDQVVLFLKKKNIKSAFIDFGGQIYVAGQEKRKAFIAHPLFRNQKFLEVPLTNASISTSSNSQQYVRKKGKKFGHIINPASGQPVNWDGSASVISPSAAKADALSTAFFVKGLKDGLLLANALNVCAVFLSPSKLSRHVNVSYSQECLSYIHRGIEGKLP